MAQQTNNLRERLLAALPQPENLAEYRKETEVLLAKHEKALFWEERTGRLIFIVAIIGGYLYLSPWAQRLGQPVVLRFGIIGGLGFLAAGLDGLQRYIHRNVINLLKEVKQVQLQVLELQASLGKAPENQP
jgi:hypothetical protein